MPLPFTVNYAPGARAFARELIGRDFTDEELAQAVGALDGAVLEVRKKKGVDEIRVKITHSLIDEQERWIRRDSQDALLIFNYRFYKKKIALSGVSIDSLVRQIFGARALGVQRLETFGAGNFTSAQQPDGEIGYLLWAKFGFDAPLSENYQAMAAAELGLIGVKTLNEVIETPQGENWWYHVGSALAMKFDLAPDSSMMAIFRNYVRRKGKIV